MSDENEMKSQKPMQQTLQRPCIGCGKEMVYIMPTPRIFNAVDVSCLMIAHPPSRCQACGSVALPLIHGITAEGIFEMEWKLAKVANRSPIIAAGDNNAIKQAIAAAQFAEKLKDQGN